MRRPTGCPIASTPLLATGRLIYGHYYLRCQVGPFQPVFGIACNIQWLEHHHFSLDKRARLSFPFRSRTRRWHMLVATWKCCSWNNSGRSSVTGPSRQPARRRPTRPVSTGSVGRGRRTTGRRSMFLMGKDTSCDLLYVKRLYRDI